MTRAEAATQAARAFASIIASTIMFRDASANDELCFERQCLEAEDDLAAALLVLTEPPPNLTEEAIKHFLNAPLKTETVTATHWCCGFSFFDQAEVDEHRRSARHVATNHAVALRPSTFYCECGKIFTSSAEREEHWRTMGARP